MKRPFHSISHAERSAYVSHRRQAPRDSQIAITRRFWRKLCFISLPFKIFRRLNALFTPIRTQNVVHTNSSVKTSPETLQSLSFADFGENYALFLSRLRYFDIETPFSLHFACRKWSIHFPAAKQNHKLENRCNSQILTKIMRYFPPVWDISTFKRPFHSISHAERSANDFQRQNRPRNSKIAIIRRLWRKLCVISLPFKIFRCLSALFSPLRMQNLVHTFSSVKTRPETLKS